VVTLALWLACVGTTDLVASLSGRPESRRRALAAVIAGCVVPGLLSRALGCEAGTTAVVVLVSAVTSAAWTGVRLLPWAWTAAGAQVVLAGFAAVATGILVLSALGPDPEGGTLERWLGEVGLPLLRGHDPGYLSLVGAVGLVLLGTANSLVRLTLASVGADTGVAERRMRAGRLIGVIERLLIAGFTLAGEPTAAVVVVSAKSLIRLPEISGVRSEIDDLTEYLLVGSLTSWLIAFVGAALLLGPA
jgi:hypothetical protein